MKSIIQVPSSIWLSVTFLLGATSLFAQDDLYYNPSAAPVVTTSTTVTTTTTTTTTETSSYSDSYSESGLTSVYDESGYYDDEDDYAYEYSSRIRRFHNRSMVSDYYDPFYSDMYFYDPYYLPGSSIYVVGFDDYWSYRRWRRWNRWNRWNEWGSPYAYSPWGWNAGFNNWGWGVGFYSGWGSPWNNPCVVNNYFYDPYWTWNGFNPYYGQHHHYYYGNNQSNNDGGYRPSTYTGPRRGGSGIDQGYTRFNDRNGRITTANPGGATVELQRPNGRIVRDAEPEAGQVERVRGDGRKPTVAAPEVQRNPSDVERSAPKREVSPVRPERSTPAEVRPERSSPSTVRPEKRETPSSSRPSREVTPERRSEPEARPTREARPERRQNPSTTRDNGFENRPSRNESPSFNRGSDSPSRGSSGNSGGGFSPSRSNSGGGNSGRSGRGG